MSIHEYRLDNGEIRWRVRVKRHGIQREKSGFKTPTEAMRAQKELEKESIREAVRREEAGAAYGQLVHDWELALRKGDGILRPVQETTIEDNIRVLQIYTDHWSKRPADEISVFDVREVLRKMEAEGLSNARKRHLITAINGLYRWARENGRVKGTQHSPAFGVRIDRKEERRPESWTLAEIRKLLELAKRYEHPWYPIWAGALLTGMRSGELYALEKTDIDWESRVIRVSKSYNARLKRVKSTKAGYWRDIPMNRDLELLLKELQAKNPDSPYVFPHPTEWKRSKAAEVLRGFCVGIGLPPVKFHTLRACFATQLIRNKIAPAVVMKICGWKDLETMQRYIRLAGIEIEGATEALQLLPVEDVMGKVVSLFHLPQGRLSWDPAGIHDNRKES